MTLHYTLVFMLLVAEIAVFLLLAIPLPLQARRKIFNFLSENPFVAKIQYGLKITFIFILILFVDSVNRVYRVLLELSAAEKVSNSAAALLASERQEVQARKFYNQRNMYLCGFTLLLLIILNRTYTLILDVLHLEEKIEKYEGSSTGSKKTGTAGSTDEVAALRKELAKKELDLSTLKKQAEGLQLEYNQLCDKYGETQASAGSKKTK
ncbi:hypothetical protein F503_05187 [Ophiostoma piceae UAMH 11346]|uniref:Endoplasmic reticulum transmembrane protein n=1 Tax=Ophiostoma piceae (strain UAMH 11346) TaxID=1262450 RepID=S3CB06_OPHP1|nr:hypothetical protein F503_05187 [Ophiostoma piceae UAMH 11346]